MKHLVFLFMLISCTHQSNWKSSHVYSQKKAYTSNKLTYKDPIYKEIELEIINYSDCIKCYLNFFNLPLDKKNVQLIFKNDHLIFEDTAYVLKGGQRILISKEGTKQLIQLLQTGDDISIIYNNTQLDLPTKGFKTLFNKNGLLKNKQS